MSASPIISFFFFSISLVLLPTTHATFNITRILKKYPQFDTYNENLSQTGLNKYINGQKSATVLVIANDQLRSFATMQKYEVKKVLTFHLIFGYYDAPKLKGFPTRTTLPTFYQGAAAMTSNYEGGGIVNFRSSGESTDQKGVQLLDTIEAQRDAISVLQIASLVPMIAPSPPPPQLQAPSASPVASSPRKLMAPTPSTQGNKPPTVPQAPPPATKTTPSTPSPPTPSPPPAATANKTKPSISSPPPPSSATKSATTPSSATKPSGTAPSSEPPAESTSTASSPPTETQVPESSSDENKAPSPVVSPPKPTSETPAAAAASDGPASSPASGSAPAPAPEKSTAPARERLSSGNYLASSLLIFTAACFLFTIV